MTRRFLFVFHIIYLNFGNITQGLLHFGNGQVYGI